MTPQAFAYEKALSMDQALHLFFETPGEVRYLAGGHSLLPLMKLRLATPDFLVDLGDLTDLRGLAYGPDSLVIGALTDHATIARAPARPGLEAVQETASGIGDVEVRNRGTIGGNLVHADPASDWPGTVIALRAMLRMEGRSGSRTLPADAFFVAPFQTALEPGEILTSVHIPLPTPHQRAASAYGKFAHPASGYAVVGIAVSVTLDEDGIVADIGVGVSGVALSPYRAQSVEEELRGTRPTPDCLAAAARRVSEEQDVNSDAFASSTYRSHLAEVYAMDTLQKAIRLASG